MLTHQISYNHNNNTRLIKKKTKRKEDEEGQMRKSVQIYGVF